VVQNPTFFGDLLDVDGLAEAVHAAGALLVVVALPVHSLGLLKPPGSMGRISWWRKASRWVPV